MSVLATRPDSGPSATAEAQYVTCTLGDAEYGIDILSVREIKGWSETTALPHAPDWVRGVINLRGTIVPILDLRARFGLGLTATTAMHVVVIIQTATRMAGLLVDGVSDIIAVAAEEVRAVPEIGTSVPERLLAGLIPREGGMVSLVSLDNLLNLPDAETTPAQ
ncbi:chemotaxis protein CheW [Falsiroseomonas stagni]|uniref:Purine-binding chemotaxis protein CheW n=1 Tax=Falsiroseomonas stagni DSM 19981 TaxID=1123062 RepID=A0A1I3X9Z3_9PROT|nr:chemotaxis protein CheW [Falsiroseomonas stagni]SFK16452.1 purine-binding chemotaxis protein CheW [Falsiroseomonas stagni DSM 19981]